MKSAAIIGISNHARQHLLVLAEQMLQGRLRLAAATIVNQEEEHFFCRRLEQIGCEVFRSADEMWRKMTGRIDLCCIPTGIHLHAAMTLQALRAGAHVLVEKPLAASVAQAREIMAVEKATGRFTAVGFQDLYTPSTWEIKRLLLAGQIGTIESITFVGLWPRADSYYTRNDWAGRLQQNGQPIADSPVNNAFAHFLNLALFWAGPTAYTSARVTAVACELYRTRRIESFDTCCARAELSAGCPFLIYASHSSREDRPARLVLKGSRGTLVWETERHYEIHLPGTPSETHPLLGKFETKIAMGDAVADHVHGRPAPLCTTAIALEHLRLAEWLHTAQPIHDIDKSFLHHDPTATGGSHIRGLEAATDRAVESQRLWSEMGLPWTRPARHPRAPFSKALKKKPLPC